MKLVRISQIWSLSGYGIMYSEPYYACFGWEQVLAPRWSPCSLKRELGYIRLFWWFSFVSPRQEEQSKRGHHCSFDKLSKCQSCLQLFFGDVDPGPEGASPCLRVRIEAASLTEAVRGALVVVCRRRWKDRSRNGVKCTIWRGRVIKWRHEKHFFFGMKAVMTGKLVTWNNFRICVEITIQ